nr:hypothetical protein [Tanacetum cinerariifolium]GEX53669.1 hypothetical protein [Tanacetum cinerariifolium]
MFEEDQTIDVVALPKFDMPSCKSSMSTKDVKSLALHHGIPLDLHPVALTKGWTMDQLLDDMIGLYEPYFEFSGIRKGERNNQLRSHIVPPLPAGQAIPDKTDHQKEVEMADPKIVATRERNARAAAKKKEKKKRCPDEGEGSRPHRKRKKTSTARRDSSAASEHVSSPEPIRMVYPVGPNMENPSGDQTKRNLTIVPTEVLQTSLGDHFMHRSLTAERTTSPARLSAQGAHGDEGESSRDQAYYVQEWFVHQRFENLQADYNSLAKTHADCGDTNDHAGCTEQFQLLEGQNSELSQVNKDQALKIKELKYTLARKDSALVYAERINAGRAQEVTQLSKSEMEKFDCILKLLAIMAGWGKGLSEERSEEDLLALMIRMEGFDVYADKKMCVEYNKMFEKKIPLCREDLSRLPSLPL